MSATAGPCKWGHGFPIGTTRAHRDQTLTSLVSLWCSIGFIGGLERIDKAASAGHRGSFPGIVRLRMGRAQLPVDKVAADQGSSGSVQAPVRGVAAAERRGGRRPALPGDVPQLARRHRPCAVGERRVLASAGCAERLKSAVEVRSAVSGPGSLACEVGQPQAVGLAEGRECVRRQRMVAHGVLVARQPLGEEGLQVVFGRRGAE